MASKNDSPSFEANYKKLQQLSQELQGNRVSVDELIPRMKEALVAARACKEVLKETKSQLKELSDEFSAQAETQVEPAGDSE